MYNIVICDDNCDFIEYMKGCILSSGMSEHEFNFYEYVSGEALINDINSLKCDLLILDIQLPGINGNNVAKIFRRSFPNTILVLCSGIYKPSDESFKLNAYRYLYKTYSDEKMKIEVREIIDNMKKCKEEHKIIASFESKKYVVDTKDILYIDIVKRGCRLHLSSNSIHFEYDGKLIINLKLSEVYELLKNNGFVYAHNSYIVNVYKIKKVSNKEIFFINEKEISVAISRSKALEFKSAFTRIMSEKK